MGNHTLFNEISRMHFMNNVDSGRRPSSDMQLVQSSDIPLRASAFSGGTRARAKSLRDILGSDNAKFDYKGYSEPRETRYRIVQCLSIMNPQLQYSVLRTPPGDVTRRCRPGSCTLIADLAVVRRLVSCPPFYEYTGW